MKGIDNVAYLGMRAGIILKWTIHMCGFGVRTGIIELTIRSSGKIL
jgi:hypothetical protein